MTSVVEICNMALGNIRAGSINDINEPSLQAQTCKLRYEILRDKLLRETMWNFARRIEALALVTDTIFVYPYSYAYPSDCLRIEKLIGEYEQVTLNGSAVAARSYDPHVKFPQNFHKIDYSIYQFGNKKLIGAYEANLRIDYVVKVTDPNLFSADFVLALSHLLASEIAVPIVGGDAGRRFRADSLEIYQQYLASAIVLDANEKYSTPPESEFVTVRR